LADRLWHVTVTLVGPTHPVEQVRSALQRFAERHQFLLSGRYAANRAEIRYWDEGQSTRDTAARALRLWSEHADVAHLPPWEVVGLEVVDQETFHVRGRAGELTVSPVASGDVRPF
jgi:hypothetical protein